MPLPTLHQPDTAEEEVSSDLRRCRRKAGSHASRESLGSLMARMSRGGGIRAKTGVASLINQQKEMKTLRMSVDEDLGRIEQAIDELVKSAMATEERLTQKLNWKTDSPVWVEQWLLSKETLKALQELVDEQLAKGHIVETTSPWNSPVFVIKKANKGKWQHLHDLCQINNVIEDMGSLQPGMTSPVMVPQNWNLAIIDIKDCFFQIPLHPDDAPHFTFSVPTLN
ncbi:hypothetical protein DUI87_02517 [Hirundo rustica rustica]|uniref:ribonuclease H n=1 Tax=Hirundo rustica rustica TaxID=333673 RepID=A0A3M0LFE9_HIRRU|nr:hypothetical protein DUI87_02517 [Hirundo rustica rustica]